MIGSDLATLDLSLQRDLGRLKVSSGLNSAFFCSLQRIEITVHHVRTQVAQTASVVLGSTSRCDLSNPSSASRACAAYSRTAIGQNTICAASALLAPLFPISTRYVIACHRSRSMPAFRDQAALFQQPWPVIVEGRWREISKRSLSVFHTTEEYTQVHCVAPGNRYAQRHKVENWTRRGWKNFKH